MATLKQKLAVEKLVENHGKSVSGAMRAAGYDPDTAKNPKNLTESKGFKELMEKAGLTPDLIINSVVEDIKAKPGKRVGEMRLGADMLGLTKRDSPIAAIQINIGDEKSDYS